VRIHDKLLPHLRRWHRMDLKDNIAHVVHYHGKHIQKLRRSWPEICKFAQLDPTKGPAKPHTLRHTCVTWLLQAGVPTWEVAGFVGMSEAMVREVYGHHRSDYQKNAARAQNKPAHVSPKKQHVL
ncbi:MAG: tyrosine-type recombinase/integrase, partial [Hyphomicrobiaceae bacterium]